MPTLEARAEQFYQYVTSLKSQVMKPQFDFLESKVGNLNLKEVSILLILDQVGSCNMRFISRNLNLAVSTTTSIVDRMVRNQLVKRERTERDRRIVLVSLTEKGKEINSFIRDKSIQLYNVILSRLSEKEQTTLLRIFKKMTSQEIESAYNAEAE